MTLHRTVHVASLASPDTLGTVPRLSSPRILTADLYRLRHLVFLYCEWRDLPGVPEELVPDLGPLVPWPDAEGSTRWVGMPDVFHFNQPVDEAHWRRPVPPEKRIGRIAFLKPEKVASYVYYHYQLQEERAFGGGKYESIYLLGTMLFQYKEWPVVEEVPPVPGLLNTRGTPTDWSQARMDQHFAPWPDGYLYFKDLEWLTPR